MIIKKELLLAADLLSSISSITSANSFEGGYMGLSVGNRSTDIDWTTTSYTDPNGTPEAFASNKNASLDDDEIIPGIYAGYTWQLQNDLTFGIEASYQTADNEKTKTRLPGTNSSLDPAPFGHSTLTAKTTSETSFRARLGYLVTPDFQIYGAGGIAFQKLKLSSECPRDTNICNPGLGTKSYSKSKTLEGWTVGLGAEYALAENWLARIEYNYSDFGDLNYTAMQAIPGESYGVRGKAEITSEVISAGIAYKF